ncbi:hypothetical protein PG987_007876 [Apiospora arundinis]
MSEVDLLVQAATGVIAEQDARRPVQDMTGLTSSSKSPDSGANATPDESATQVAKDRREKESAAKTALQDAARKLRELAATSSYDIVKDIQDVDQAINELVGDRGRKQAEPAPAQPTQAPPRHRSRRARRRRHRDAVDEERERPCEVQRAPMEDWPPNEYLSDEEDEKPKDQSAPHANRLPTVIQAFYWNIPSTLVNSKEIVSERDFKDAHSISQDREKPQRVLLHSALLVTDLERISGLQLPNQPQELIPPFKLLVHSWPGVENALQSLKEEQKAGALEEQSSATAYPPPIPKEEETSDVPRTQQQNSFQADKDPKSDAERAKVLLKEKLSLRIKHLEILVDFIKTDLAHLIGLRMKIRDVTLDSITFEELYHLYNPGDLIINRKASVDHLHQVYAVTGGRTRLARGYTSPRVTGDEADDSPDAGIGTWTDVVIDCFRMRWDGTQIGPFRLIHRIRHYVGERKITNLDFYPVRFRGNPEEICNALVARGKRVLECHGHMKYEGLTVDPTGQQSLSESYYYMHIKEAPVLTYESVAGVSHGGQEIEGDVYIDMKTYHQTLKSTLRVFEKLRRVQPSVREVTENLEGFGPSYDYHTGDHDVDEAKSDQFMSDYFHLINPKTPEELDGRTSCLALLSRAVPAYEFRSRSWIWIDISKIEPIDKSDETRTRGWRDLVIDNKYRRLLESLVNNHMSPAEQKRVQSQIGEGMPTSQIDLIQGKGRGLIILLHGPPGTGKTSTAEAIAAYTGKPLYAITCGDIGLGADEVEEKLLKHTRLAEKWGCVLLLDEADVFLARRSWNDVQRNALVSVFLRRLEYYSGILFLTTNIVGLIDEAFKSRIHVALRYDKIDEDTTERIWHNLLRRIKRDNQASDVKITFDERELLDFAMGHYEEHARDESTWNARQIRNAFSTAIAMGQFDRLERIRQEGVSPDEVLASGNKSLATIKLTKRNFSKIANISDDFEHYINAVRGADAENARMNQQRDDFFLRERMPPTKRYSNRDVHLDDDYVPSSGRRWGYQSSSQASRPTFKGKSAARKPTNWDEADARDSEAEESQHDSDVRPRRVRRSRKVSSDEEADRYGDD